MLGELGGLYTNRVTGAKGDLRYIECLPNLRRGRLPANLVFCRLHGAYGEYTVGHSDKNSSSQGFFVRYNIYMDFIPFYNVRNDSAPKVDSLDDAIQKYELPLNFYIQQY